MISECFRELMISVFLSGVRFVKSGIQHLTEYKSDAVTIEASSTLIFSNGSIQNCLNE